MKQKISIVDYGMGNVHSVMSVVKYLGYDAIITNDHKELLDSTKIILPGVGEFRSAIINLERLNLSELIKDIYKSKKQKFWEFVLVCNCLLNLVRKEVFIKV